MKTVLYIDTSSNEKTIVGIESNGKRKTWQITGKIHASQEILLLIEKALQELKLKLTDISEIKVVPGPGSFTGLRVGVTVANTLGWVLHIAVNGKDLVYPYYSPSKFDS